MSLGQIYGCECGSILFYEANIVSCLRRKTRFYVKQSDCMNIDTTTKIQVYCSKCRWYIGEIIRFEASYRNIVVFRKKRIVVLENK